MKHPKEMTGLEFLQAMVDGHIPRASISETIPMDLDEISHGHASFKVKADSRHLNPLGGVHGGFAATALDSATGCAVHTTLEAGVGYGTIDLNVKMIRALQAHQTYRAEAEVITIGRTLLTAEGRIIGDDGKIHAFGSASCLVIK